MAGELRLLRIAWRWGREHGHLAPRLELPTVRLHAEPAVERYTPTREEVRRVLAHLSGWRRTAVRLLYGTGCRVGEIATARRKHLDVARGILRVKGKTGRRAVRISRRLIDAVLPDLPTDPEERLLGVTPLTVAVEVRKALHDACDAEGLPRWTAQALRRSATDRLIEGGAAPGTEASHLGHSPAIALTNYHKPRDLALDQAAELLDDLDRPAGLRTVLTWTAEEWALVEAAAGRLGQDPAEWARRLLLAAAAPPAPSTPTPTRGRSRSRSRHTPGTV